MHEGADPFIKDNEGNNAFDLASSLEVEELLKSWNKRNPSISSFVSPFNEIGGTGEGTTYIISDLGDEKYVGCDFDTNIQKHSSKGSNIELKEIYVWLENIHLEELYEILVDAGYDNSFAMVQQMKGPMPITESNLYDIGITRPGHCKRILWKLEQEINQKHGRHPSVGILKCCGQLRDGTGGMFNIPNLHQMLIEIDCVEFFDMLVEAGYDNYEIILNQFRSKYGITKEILLTEVGMQKIKPIKKILNRINNDLLIYKQHDILFDEGKVSACEFCNIS